MELHLDHGCGRTHHGWASLAECWWPDAAFVTGDGPHALVARCGMVSVALHESAAEARARGRRLDSVGCGRGCRRDHEVVDLAQPVASSAR
jgi:hypothetical protein